jgi:hypothetical protein
MKKIIIPLIKIAAVIIAGTLALTACHATPSTPPVTNKNNGVLESRLAQAALEGRYDAPQTWKATYTHGKLTVDIDATVETPDVTQYPAYQIAPLDVSQDLTNKLAKVLMQGKTIYPIRDMNKDMTKAEILQKIADLKAGKNSDMHTADPAAYAKFIQPQVAQLEAMLASAPDTIDRKPSNGKLGPLDVVPASSLLNLGSSSETSSNDGLQKYTGLFVETDPGQTNLATLRIQKSADDKDESVVFNSGTRLFPTNTDVSKLPALTISADQGAEIARKAVAELGLTDMKIAVTDTTKLYYEYHFTQTVQGIPMNFTEPPFNQYRMGGKSVTNIFENDSSSSSESDLQDAQYAEPWYEESLNVSVENTGLVEFAWSNPEKIGKTVTQNVALLPFDQIEQKFANAMEYEGVFTNNPLVEQRTIHVTKISLGMARIPQKDHVGSYLLVPAWDLYGTCTDKMSDKEKDPNLNANHEFVYNQPNTSYATINAIDGTIINRSWGGSKATTMNYVADSK